MRFAFFTFGAAVCAQHMEFSPLARGPMVAEFPGRLEIGVIFRYRALLANLLHVMGCFASVIRLFFVSWNVRGSILE